MEATNGKIKDFFDGKKQHIIPIHQRKYSWTKNVECKQLFDDILKIGQTDTVKNEITGKQEEIPYYIGAMVYKDISQSQITKRVVEDGQQRITSITLLVLGMIDRMKSQPKLCAMYVLKKLKGVSAVQTLSRLNRICPPFEKKTFVLDFVNTYDEIKDALMIDRIKAEKDMKKIYDIADLDKDIILGRDIDYDIKQDNKSREKLEKKLEKQKKELEKIINRIDNYRTITERVNKQKDFSSLLNHTIGLGVGVLTMPFTFSRSLVLGTNFMQRALNRLYAMMRIGSSSKKRIEYEITLSDIESAFKSLKSSDFLLEDILDDLDHLKYKLKIFDYKIPELEKKLKEIDVLEKGLIKKKRELTKMMESLEKAKIKVIKRNDKKDN